MTIFIRQSYDVLINLMVDGLPHTSSSNNLDLKNPYFRYTGQPPQPPPGVNTISPSESYWANLDLQSTTSGIFIIVFSIKFIYILI